MSVEETIHAAQTISRTINNHMDSLSKSASNLVTQREHIAKLAGGTRSGDTAVKLLDSAIDTLQQTVATLRGASSDLESYSKKVREA